MSTKIANKSKIEEAVLKHSNDTVLWLKDKTGKTADIWQQIAIKEIEENPRVVHVWPPRFGKTWAMEAVCLKELACNPYEREMIFGPVQKQANNALKEHLDWIETSPILSKWLAFRRGKKQISETKYEFWNHSQAETFGIRSNFDSENATILRGEEWDDIDVEIWNNRVIQRGGRKNISGLPLRIRLSGTIQWGKGPIFIYDHNTNYHTITKFDIYDGIKFGIYDELALEEIREQCSDDQWLRIYLLQYTDTSNFIWESNLRECLQESLKLKWEGIEYVLGGRYKPRGTVYMGLDCGHSGQKKVHSVYRADFIEVYGDHILWLNGKEWESTTDPEIIAYDLCNWWEYYDVTAGYGDALKANDIAMINDMLFDRGLISGIRNEHPENKPSDWDRWNFSPKWNTAKAKYLWGTALKTKVDNKKIIFPYFDKKDNRHIAQMARHLLQAVLNIRLVMPEGGSYPRLEIIKDEIGDDPFDSLIMGIGCANDKQIIPIDLQMLGVQGNRIITSDLHTSIVSELDKGRETFTDFIN